MVKYWPCKPGSRGLHPRFLRSFEGHLKPGSRFFMTLAGRKTLTPLHLLKSFELCLTNPPEEFAKTEIIVIIVQNTANELIIDIFVHLERGKLSYLNCF